MLSWLIVALAAAGLFWAPPVQAAKGIAEPPQCTAIVVPGLQHATDGRREAWVYKARFGRLALEGVARDGNIVDYRFNLGGRTLDQVSGPIPKPVQSCMRAKGVAAPKHYAARACAGDRFKVIISRPLSERYVFLYVSGTSLRQWRFCRASLIPPEVEKPKAASGSRSKER